MKKDTPRMAGKTAVKKTRKRPAYGLKLKVIKEISNGRISKNHASKKYEIARGSIDYWMKKYTSLEEKNKYMSAKDEIKKLKKRNAESNAKSAMRGVRDNQTGSL